MTGKTRTPLLPWRYLVPRARYFESARIARACPEISGHIDSSALYAGLDGAATAVKLLALVVALPFLAVAWAGGHAWAAIPDFAEKRNAAIREAHMKVPVEEIRRRLGLEPLPTASMKPQRAPEAGGAATAEDGT